MTLVVVVVVLVEMVVVVVVVVRRDATAAERDRICPPVSRSPVGCYTYTHTHTLHCAYLLTAPNAVVRNENRLIY